MSSRTNKKAERNKLIVRVVCIVLAAALVVSMITLLLGNL